MHALLEFLQDIGPKFVEFFNIRQQTDLPRTQDSTRLAPTDPRHVCGSRCGCSWVPVMRLEFLNRSGPGMICTTTPTSASCEEQWSPWPWLAICILLLVGVACGSFGRTDAAPPHGDEPVHDLSPGPPCWGVGMNGSPGGRSRQATLLTEFPILGERPGVRVHLRRS